MFDDKLTRLEMSHNIIINDASKHEEVEYNPNLAMMIGRVICDINANVQCRGMDFVQSFAQQYILPKGLKKLREKGEAGVWKELEQLHKRTCFTPVDVSEMTPSEKQKAMEALMFLTEKKDHTVKG